MTDALPTTKSTSTGAAVMVQATTSDGGTGIQAPAANSNIFAVWGSGPYVRFILDADGDSHQDVGTAWTNFDEFDDVGLLTALAVGVSRPDDAIREQFNAFLEEHRGPLERVKLVTFNEDGHHFVNMSRLTMLLVGAVRQLGAQVKELCTSVDSIKRLLPTNA